MKIELEPAKVKKSYPWIGQDDDDGNIVLFIGPSAGVVLEAGMNGQEVGFYSASWNEERFSQYHGSIRISNY